MSNVSINGANISNGIFQRTNFTNSDLSNTIAKNCYFRESIFKNTNMFNINFGIQADMIGHTDSVSSISYSPDGKHIVSCS